MQIYTMTITSNKLLWSITAQNRQGSPGEFSAVRPLAPGEHKTTPCSLLSPSVKFKNTHIYIEHRQLLCKLLGFHVRLSVSCPKWMYEDTDGGSICRGTGFLRQCPSIMALFLSWESKADGHGSSWLQVLQCPKGQQLRITWDEMLRVGTL